MARNGSGTYNRAVSSYVGGTIISAATVNSEMDDMATALTESLPRDGQAPPTANLPMNGFRHTGAGNGVARTDYATLGQVQDNAFLWGGTGGGTANAITVSLSPPITAYAAGQVVRFVSSAANTGAVTLNVNGLGAVAINKGDGTTALASGDLPASRIVTVTHDGTRFRIDAASSIFNVEDFNILSTNADNATGFSNLAAAVQARGGGTILFPAGQTYDVFTASFSAPVSTLMAFSSLKGVRILMNGSRIRTTRDWVSAAATCRLFQFTDCEDVDLEFSALQATGTTTDMFTTGHVGAYFINNCKRVRVRGRCEGGRSGVEVVRGAGFSFANYAEGFDIGLETQNVFYPIAFERNGRSSKIKLIAKSAGRSLFLANASNIRADVWTDNTVGYDDIVLSASCAPSEGTINNACDNIDLKVTHRPPFAGTSALSALVTLVYQQMDSVNETVPGRFSNISVKFDCDYQGNADLVPAKFFYAATQKFGSVNATASTAHYMDNIKVSGAVFAPAGTAILTDFLRDGNAALGASAVIGNVSFEDWVVTGGSGAQSFEIQVSVVDFNLTLKNINNLNGNVNFAGTLPVGILDASQGVITSNFRSSGSNANGRYRRLPDGRMRQWGTAPSVTAVANTTVTLPLSFRDNAGLPQLQSATSGTTDVLNIGSVTASNFAINRPGGSSAISVAWAVEGDA